MTSPAAPGRAEPPPILYGTAWKGERTAGLVERALALGFRGVDTACQPKHYDEAGVGRGLAAAQSGGIPREAIYVQTKFTPVGGQDPRRIPYDPRAPIGAQVEQSCAVSLANLGVDHLDALLLHSPVYPAARMEATWRALEAQVDAGRVKALGLSNCYDPAELGALVERARIVPCILQNRFYAKTGHDRVIREICARDGIRYQSFWTLTANAHVLASPTLRSIAARHGATPAQIFLRYVTLLGITPLTGTTSEAHMREDLAIFDIALSDGDRAALDRLLDGAAPAV